MAIFLHCGIVLFIAEKEKALFPDDKVPSYSKSAEIKTKSNGFLMDPQKVV